MVSRENISSSKSIAMSDYYLRSTDSDDSTVNSEDGSHVYEEFDDVYKVADPVKRRRSTWNTTSVNDTLNDNSELHPLGVSSNQMMEKKKFDLVKMYKSRKQKEEELKRSPSSRIDELEEEIAHLKIEIACIDQDREVALHSSQKTAKENKRLKAELELMIERESGYVLKISDLEKGWMLPRRSVKSLSSNTTTSISPPLSIDTSKFNISQIDTTSLKTKLDESNALNENLKKDLDKMKKLLDDFQRPDYNYVHTIEEGEKNGWMDQMLGRKAAPVRRGVNDLLWSESTRALNLDPSSRRSDSLVNNSGLNY